MNHTLDCALKCGYRAIDTASVYRNEKDIGDSIEQLLPKYGLKREDLFITSKLGPKDQGADACRACFVRSLGDLGLDYLDLYLIHWPGVQGHKLDDPRNAELRMHSWRTMEQLHLEGKIKNIGVSNYTKRHLEELLSKCEIKPAVLQIEHHPYLNQTELVELCREHGIHFQAYSSLGTSAADNQLLSDPVVASIASLTGRSPAQVLLRWSVQQGIGVIPKSTNPDHIQANIDIFDFELSKDQMAELSSLHTDVHLCWDPNTVT